nr:hypothetical protein [Tanacetum cinerariifolium]
MIKNSVNLDPILHVLAKVFDQALEGGGVKNINFHEAIGVLEGIALVGDPEFAIVDEAYPYIAQVLLTHESPRLRSALRYTVYGKYGFFDAERFIDVMQAFESFITAAKSGGGEDLNGDMAHRANSICEYVTEEDKIILNNVQKIIEFLTVADSRP